MRSIQEKIYWIWISRVPNVRGKTIQKLLQNFNSLEEIFNLSKKQLIQEGISEKLAENIVSYEYRKNMEKFIGYMERENINIITIHDIDYPAKLKIIEGHPMYLYVKGNMSLLKKKSIAVVGTRNCTNYGKQIAKEMSYKLVQNNVVVISGLAKGIDTYAHIGAIKRKASTIAVLGCGIDIIYPSENKKLADKILNQNGLIISEYVMGTKIEKYNFPARNRIVSGLSDGVLVVEAPKKSGALITVDFALEQGKDVYVIPSNINNICAEGSNQLLKEGAKLVDRVEDILF